MYIHINPEFLQKYPWVGVLIGGTGVALMVFLTDATWSEYQRYSRQGHPIDVTPETARLDSGEPRSWVTLRGAEWICDDVVQETRTVPERWIFGSIDNTQIPARPAGDTVIVLKLDGDVPCASVAGRPLTGVLTREGDGVWGGSVTRQIREARSGLRILVLHPGVGPEKARTYAFAGAGFLLAFMLFALYYVRLWSRQRRLRESSPMLPPYDEGRYQGL